MDGQVVNLYRVLRDPVASARLAEGLALTPFSREEYEAAYLICSDPVEMARRFLVRASMGHGSNAATRKIRSGFRAKRAGAASPACDFSNYPSQVALFHARLQGVTIERKPALDILERYDSPDTLFYLDPPYVTETRTLNHTSYRHEFLDEDHEQLAAALNAILEGYQQNDQLNTIIKQDLFAAKPIRNSPSHAVRKARNVVVFAWRRGESGHIADTRKAHIVTQLVELR